MPELRVFPSILSAKFEKLGTQVQEAEAAGCSGIHVDVMDGQFVPPITFGAPIVRAVRASTSLLIDVHMMVIDPDKHFEELAEAGANSITVHYEALTDVFEALEQLEYLGLRKSIAIRPRTEVHSLYPVLERLDQVLIMSVEPGYGGQKFIPQTIGKIKRLGSEISKQGVNVEIQVDGGINVDTISDVAKVGIDIAVVGSALFNDSFTVEEGFKSIMQAAEGIED
ncbi:MAG: ribulose-phosphate 3-epimerase [Chloroflexota bacterium]|nr:ribulose-phosphate 3-epimerase [Chloroflexota bacterium]